MKFVIALGLVVMAAVMVSAAPSPGEDKKKPDMDIEIERTRNGGTRGTATVRKEVYDNGRTRVETEGFYDRTWGGRNNGQRDYGGKVRVEHNWGR